MNLKIKFDNNIPQIRKEYSGKVEQILTAWGDKQNDLWRDEIAAAGLVDTGRFIGSPKKQVNIGAKEVVVGTDINDPPYPIFLEKGTRRIAPRPTLEPSILNHMDDYKQIAEDILKG